MTTIDDTTPASSAPTPTLPAATGAVDGGGASYRLTLGRVVRSEWIKLRSLRGTWVFLGVLVLIMVGLATLAAAVSTGSLEGPDGDGGPGFAGDGALQTVLTGANFATLLIGVFGCLAGAREYGSRMITATVAAAPRRWPVVISKVTAVVALVLPTALIATFAAFGVGMAVLSAGDAPTVSLGDEGVLGNLIGMGFYLTAVCVIGLALGILLRSVAGSISALVAFILILPGIVGALLPDSFDTVLQFLPTNAASTITAVQSSGDSTLGTLAGALTLAGWVVLGLAGSVVAIMRRDV